jgi:hypothetical protein
LRECAAAGEGAGGRSCNDYCPNNCSIHVPNLLRACGCKFVTPKRSGCTSGSVRSVVKQPLGKIGVRIFSSVNYRRAIGRKPNE